MRHIAPAENGITEGIIWKQLLFFFFPILFGTFFQQLYNTADAVIVGRFVGKEALAAVGGSTSVLINLIVGLYVGLSSGVTVAVAQAYGAQKFEELSESVHTAVAMALLVGAGMTVIGLLVAPFALEAMGTPTELMDGALAYLRIYLLGLAPSFLYNVGAGVLRAVGDTRRPLYYLIIACLTNIALDLFFVVLLGWGVYGVAIATLVSQLACAALVTRALLQPGQIYRVFRKEIRISPSALKNILRVGVPAGIQSDMYSISNIILQSCINSFGTNTIVAWTAFGKIDGFFWMVMGAYGISITTFVGQNFGAQKYDRVRKSVKVCLGMSMATGVACSLLLWLGCGVFLHLFTTDTAVLEIGVEITRFLAPFYFTYVCVEILSGAIRGTGDSVVPMLMVCGGICIMRILWIFFVLPHNRTLLTVITSYPITWAITSMLFILYYWRGPWMRRRIAKCGYEPEKRPEQP